MSCKKAMIFLGLVLIAVLDVRGDVIVPPALHRMGYEIIIATCASLAAGCALLRYEATGNWRMTGEWKCTDSFRVSEIAEIKQRLDTVSVALRTAFRREYERFDGPLDDGWMQDVVFRALESDAMLMERCKGIPVEFLFDVLLKEVDNDLISNLVAVMPEVRQRFNDIYRSGVKEWAVDLASWMVRPLMDTRPRYIVERIIDKKKDEFCLSCCRRLFLDDFELAAKCRGVEILDLAVCLAKTIRDNDFRIWISKYKRVNEKKDEIVDVPVDFSRIEMVRWSRYDERKRRSASRCIRAFGEECAVQKNDEAKSKRGQWKSFIGYVEKKVE